MQFLCLVHVSTINFLLDSIIKYKKKSKKSLLVRNNKSRSTSLYHKISKNTVTDFDVIGRIESFGVLGALV